MLRSSSLSLVLAFILGAAAGIGGMLVLPRAEPSKSGVTVETATPAASTGDVAMQTEGPRSVDVSVVPSRALVGEVEKSTTESPVPVVAPVVVPDRMRGGGPEDRQAWLDNLRNEDPVRYQELMERREAARQSTHYELAKRAAHFLYDDQELGTEEEALQRVRMLKLLEESIDLTDKLSTVQSEEQRREIGRTIRENMRELSPLLEAERDREFFRIGKDIGYTDDDAAAFALYVRDVIDMTSTRSIFREGMRAMGGGGPWGGDRVRP